MWRYVPFYIAVAAAPLLFGGVKPESQAVLGILLGLSLLATWKEPAGVALPKWLALGALFFLILPLVPLPFGVVQLASPERARLAAEFPIDQKIPAWLTLSTSPARTIHRLWEIALAMAAFTLSRRAAAHPGARRRLAATLAIGLALVAASDIWSREHGRETILGLWSISWGKGAGTFANRNHFANWIYLAAFYCAGWSLRSAFRREHFLLIPFIAAAVILGLGMALTSASRGGAFSFLIGAGLFLVLLRRRFQQKSFTLVVSFAIVALFAAALANAEPLIRRLRTEGASLTYKTEIWRQAIGIAERFPITGAGPGGFVRVYNYYKTGHGDGTFLHAENDPLELVVEIGLAGAVCVFLVLFRLIKSKNDSPLSAAILAGLTVFAIHSLVEFVSYVPANLILVATLQALASAQGGQKSVLAPRWRILLAMAMVVIAALQFTAWHSHWQAHRASAPAARAAHIERALALWPFAADRRIGQMRAAAEGPLSSATALDRQVSRALHLDPLNWSLRLEQTWFQLAYSTNRARALSNAWLCVRLNPLQGQIPYRFARRFSQSDPDAALQFLAAVHPGAPANHRLALGLAWEMTRDPAQLWSLTPNTVPTILNLIHFAQQEKLHQIAAEACQTLEGRVEAERLAELFLQARRPDQSLRLVEGRGSLRAEKLRLEALHQLSRHAEAVAAAQSLFANPTFREPLQNKVHVDAAFTQLLENHQAHPADPVAALLLAEKTAGMEPVDLTLLAALARNYPNESRIAYLLFLAQRKDPPAAAATAVVLANRLIR